MSVKCRLLFRGIRIRQKVKNSIFFHLSHTLLYDFVRDSKQVANQCSVVKKKKKRAGMCVKVACKTSTDRQLGSLVRKAERR